MRKDKPRHNPDKPSNKWGKKCPYYEEHTREDGTKWYMCEFPNGGPVKKCKGNRHNCIKTAFSKIASIKNETKRDCVITHLGRRFNDIYSD